MKKRLVSFMEKGSDTSTGHSLARPPRDLVDARVAQATLVRCVCVCVLRRHYRSAEGTRLFLPGLRTRGVSVLCSLMYVLPVRTDRQKCATFAYMLTS